MATYRASIDKALHSQDDLKTHREHCSVDPDKLASIGRCAGQQVRIKRNDAEYGVFTVSEVRQEVPDRTVRVVVLTGADPAFSAGGDVRLMVKAAGILETDDGAVGLWRWIRQQFGGIACAP